MSENLMTLFEIASRKKYRFATERGQLDVSDLWDLPLLSKGLCLNGVAVQLHTELEALGQKSFVSAEPHHPRTVELQNKLDIVKRIIQVREAEAALATQRRERQAQRAVILDALATKQKQAIEGLSEAELLARLAETEDP